MSKSHILVAGNIPIDLLIYPSPSPASKRDKQKRFAHRWSSGATLIADLLSAAITQDPSQILSPIHTISKGFFLERTPNAITELEIFGEAVKAPFSFKVKHRELLETVPIWNPPSMELKANGDLDVLVYQDAEPHFTQPDTGKAVDFFRKSRPRAMIYHMAPPLGVGSLWDVVRRGPYGKDRQQNTESLIVVINADHLRAEGIELCHGLSWEKTCEDFVEKLGSNGKLDTLVTCAHLIVLFGCDGAIYHRGRDMIEPTLFFDPLNAEGGFLRTLEMTPPPGLAEAFIAGLATKVAQFPNATLDDGIRFGLTTMRRFAKLGFRDHVLHGWPRCPTNEVMETTADDKSLITLSIPSEDIASGKTSRWSILHHNSGDPVQVAHHIVKKGTHSAADWIPVAEFGRLVLLDRSEIEAFRTMFNAIYEYLSAPQTKPINIGIFGSRGSGKSFAAVQVANTAVLASGRESRHLRINLSQLASPEELILALNTVRDCTLSGILPIVYISGFDSDLRSESLGWLIHLLPPMHAGLVFDHGMMRHIGHAVFLFGSNTATSLKDFQGRLEFEYGKKADWDDKMAEKKAAWDDKMEDKKNISKGQQFLSCIHTFVDVLGIDQVDEDDVMYPVRRAVVLRALLEEREPRLQAENGISIDESVLDGLLLIPTFRHGLRSLKAILSMSKITGRSHFERAALPPESQLSLHLDYDIFLRFSNFHTLSDEIQDDVAERLHKTYLQHRGAMEMTDEERRDFKAQESSKPWKELDQEFKESNRSHAAEIPRKLRMIQCFLAKEDGIRPPVTNFTKKELDLLAEQEHERWNAERLQKQWQLGPRSEKKRTSPFLVPWRDLPKIWQDLDRVMVQSYPGLIPPQYKIYRIGKAMKTRLTAIPKRVTM